MQGITLSKELAKAIAYDLYDAIVSELKDTHERKGGEQEFASEPIAS